MAVIIIAGRRFTQNPPPLLLDQSIRPTVKQTIKRFAGVILQTTLFFSFAQVASATEGVTDRQILVGMTAGFSGPVAPAVNEMAAGSNAYFGVTNKKGGVHGRLIKVVALDDKYDPKLTKENTAQLVEHEHVFAMYLSRGTPQTSAMLPILEAHNVPLIAPSTGAQIFRDPISKVPANKLIINVKTPYQNEVIEGLKFFASSGRRKIGIIYSNDSFGADCLQGFNRGIETINASKPPAWGAEGMSGMRFIVDSVKPDTDAVGVAAVAANLDAIMVLVPAKAAVAVIKKLHVLKGAKALGVLTISTNSTDGFKKDLGADREYLVITQGLPPPHDTRLSMSLGREYCDAVGKRDCNASYANLEGFLAAKVFVEGLNRAGPALTRPGLIAAFETIKKKDFGGVQLSYSATDHKGNDYVELSMLNANGDYIR